MEKMDTPSHTSYYRLVLSAELARRCRQNESYSLRAFSRALRIDPAQLSRVLSGKTRLSLPSARKVAEHLTLDPRNTERFLESVIEEKHSQELKRANLDSPVHAEKLDLSADLFQMMSNWYYPAILELTQVRGFRASNAWIAKQLGISRMQASMAVSQLLRLGLLKKVGSTLIKSHRHMDTSNKSVTTSALKRLQKQVLQKIIESLENDPIETRSVSSMTLAIDPKKMGLAKELIQRFTDQLSEVLESGDQQQVYQLAVGLVPLQKNL